MKAPKVTKRKPEPKAPAKPKAAPMKKAPAKPAPVKEPKPAEPKAEPEPPGPPPYVPAPYPKYLPDYDVVAQTEAEHKALLSGDAVVDAVQSAMGERRFITTKKAKG
jgi:hypothetical protein